jgi:glycosyltransferase involved in cell wall biosynthesis
MPNPRPTLAACLIVRDDEDRLRTCLDSLQGLVDEIVVYDTGSADGTVDLACEYGATVIEGKWVDDFAAARNEALSFVRSDWVLSLDADEYLVAAHRPALPDASADALTVRVLQLAGPAGDVAHVSHPVRIFRSSAATWVGRVHERIVNWDGSPLQPQAVDQQSFSVYSTSYSDPRKRRARAEREVDLGLIELDELRGSSAAAALDMVRVLLDLGRSLLAAQRAQAALDTFELVRTFGRSYPQWLQATDYLAWTAIAAQDGTAAVALVEELASAGHDSDYCAWLAAQALAVSGHYPQALAAVRGLRLLRDPSGRTYDVALARELEQLLTQLARSSELASAPIAV